MYVAEERNGRMYALPAQLIQYAGAPLARKILDVIAERPSYPKEIARSLREGEQKIYYHIRKLEKDGIIRVVRKEERGGAVAKYYALTKPAFVVRFAELQPAQKVPKASFPPFIKDGRMNAKIVVGSPDPHGPERARSRDAHYAIDVGLFLGTYLINSQPAVHLDTELRGEGLKDNLIVVGGPVTNKITTLINAKMPIRFDKKRNIVSTRTRRVYKTDDTGLIVNMKNPYDKNKRVLLIAGKRHSGTRAAILALIKKPELLTKNTVVQGLDNDYDGIVDFVEILE